MIGSWRLRNSIFQFLCVCWIGHFRSVLAARGVVLTVAGGGQPHKGAKTDCAETATAMDGVGSKARFNYPWGIVWDESQDVIYVGDCGCPESKHTNDRIRKIQASTGEVTTVAGSATGYKDGVGKEAQFHHTSGMAIDTRRQTMYVADTGNDRIRKMDLKTAKVTTFAGSGISGFVDGVGVKAQFENPQSLAIDIHGNRLFLSDTDNHAIRIISLEDGRVKTLAGGSRGLKDGVGKEAKFYHPTGIAYDRENELLYVADHFNHVIRTVHAVNGRVTTLAGRGREGFKDGHGKDARFNYPEGLAYDPDHKILYVVEFDNHAVRMVTTKGEVSTLAGGKDSGYKDGEGSRAKFFHPTGLTFDHKRKVIYVTDQYNHMVRSISGLGSKDDAVSFKGLSGSFNSGTHQAFVFFLCCVILLVVIVVSRPYWRKRCLRTRSRPY